ncbi:hypothetical protein ACLMJK_002277 [Lecanora helva]
MKMKNDVLSLLAVYFYFITLAIAAPPFGISDYLLLNPDLPTNLSLPFHYNASLGATQVFPPESDLPHSNLFKYSIPSTNITLRFKNWQHRNRPIDEVRRALNTAMWDTIAQPEGGNVPREGVDWEAGQTIVEATPKGGYVMDVWRELTWGQWLRTIRGLALWWRAYPGLYVEFEIHEGAWDLEECWIGIGSLRVRG